MGKPGNTATRESENAAVLDYITGEQCHSDLADLLIQAGRALAGVEVDAFHGKTPYPAIALRVRGDYFAAARGMQHILLRVPKDSVAMLLAQGAHATTAFGQEGWIGFSPYSGRLDLDAWVATAMRHASRS